MTLSVLVHLCLHLLLLLSNINHSPLFCPPLFLFLHLFWDCSTSSCPTFCLSFLPSVSGCSVAALKRLPFMRNRSKDKDKDKAIYRRSMCKTAVSCRRPLKLQPLPPRLSSLMSHLEKQRLTSHWYYGVCSIWKRLRDYSSPTQSLRLNSFTYLMLTQIIQILKKSSH